MDLTPESRQQLDDLAIAHPAPKPVVREGELYSDATGWLVSQAPLPAGEAVSRAMDAHRRMLDQYPKRDTPPPVLAVLDRLVQALPPYLVPPTGGFVLTVVESDDLSAATVGHVYLYLSAEPLQKLLGARDAEHRLAFRIAQQMGRIVRGHTEHAWKMQWLNELIEDGEKLPLDSDRIREWIQTGWKEAAEGLRIEGTEEEEWQADLFALHLCRNAGFDVELAIDELRNSVLHFRDQPQAATTEVTAVETDAEALPATPYDRALLRLSRARSELDGRVQGDQFGLFEFVNPNTRVRVKDNTLAGVSNSVVCLHGMGTGIDVFRGFAASLATDSRFAGRRMFAFEYPSGGSLTRAARFFARECDRTGLQSANNDFLCYSAGGLALRYYAEVMGHATGTVVFLGTPQNGSDVRRLQPVLETRQLLGNLQLAYSEAIERVLKDQSGQIAFDLQTDSLFLRYLKSHGTIPAGAKYHVIRGRALDTLQATLLQISISTAGRALTRQLNLNSLWQRAAAEWLRLLDLPPEVTAGDLAVSLESAELESALSQTTVEVNHLRLPWEAEVAQLIRDILSGQLPQRAIPQTESASQ